MSAAAIAAPRWKLSKEPPPPPYDPFKSTMPWTAIPNDLRALRLAGKIMGEAQVWLLVYLMERQWGYRKKGEPVRDWTDPIALAVLARETGVGARALQDVVDDAIHRGLIAARKFDGQREYSYRVTVQRWAAAPPYVAGKRKPAATADEPHSREAPAAEAAFAAVVKPGANTKPHPLTAKVAAIRCRNDTEWPLALSLHAEDDGVVCFSVRAALQAARAAPPGKSGEKTANHSGSPLPLSTAKSRHRETDNSSSPLPLSPGQVVDNNQLGILRAYLNHFWLAEYGEPIDDAFLHQIAAELAPATQEFFEHRCAVRLKRTPHPESGLFLNWAADARKAFLATPQRPPQAHPAPSGTPWPEDAPGSPWRAIKAQLKASMPAQAYENWIAPTRQSSYECGVLTIVAANDVAAQWVGEEYRKQIASAAEEAGVEVDELRFETLAQTTVRH